MEKFQSKKNLVYLARGNGIDIVKKIFTDSEKFQNEKRIGDILQDSYLRIPKRLGYDEDSLTIDYEYIDALPPVDFIEDITIEDGMNLIYEICRWISEFHKILMEKTGEQYIWGDAHLRNFIYEKGGGRIYGLDFEECRIGKPESDFARIYVFLLNYNPPYTKRKIELADYMMGNCINNQELDVELLKNEIKRENEDLILRRKV